MGNEVPGKHALSQLAGSHPHDCPRIRLLSRLEKAEPTA